MSLHKTTCQLYTLKCVKIVMHLVLVGIHKWLFSPPDHKMAVFSYVNLLCCSLLHTEIKGWTNGWMSVSAFELIL